MRLLRLHRSRARGLWTTLKDSLWFGAYLLISRALLTIWYLPLQPTSLRKPSRTYGLVIGFSADRPEKEQRVGPDVLWILDNKTAWTIEAKSKKLPDNDLTKGEHGQLLQASVWVQEHYQNMTQVGVVVHPNATATKSVTVGDTMALTLPKLRELVGSVRTLLQELTSEPMPRATMVARCESKLDELNLRPGEIANRYLIPFVAEGV